VNALNVIPVVGWAIAAVICFFIAIPMFYLWNWLAPIYFYWLPAVYLDLPFWHVFGLLWLLMSLRQLLLPSVSANATTGEKKK
jgi:hypothetical protein